MCAGRYAENKRRNVGRYDYQWFHNHRQLLSTYEHLDVTDEHGSLDLFGPGLDVELEER